MTSLRFVGDLPLWLGLLLACATAGGCWFYYRRELPGLSKLNRVLLPGLRAAALVTAILILTGPVLHHRRVEGELGRVKIYLDGSSSMDLTDRAMSMGRKVAVAKSLGWIVGDHLDLGPWHEAQTLEQLRLEFQQQASLQSDATAASKLLQSLDELRSRIELPTLSTPYDSLRTELQTIAEGPEPASDAQLSRIREQLEEWENRLHQEVSQRIEQQVAAGNQTLQQALARFDENSRWQRASEALLRQDGGLLEVLRQHHEVELRGLQGDQSHTLNATFDGNSSSASLPTLAWDFSSTTDLTTGISQSLGAKGESSSESPPTASKVGQEVVVLLSDGQHNSGPPPVELARQLASQGTPVFTVATGALQPANDLALIRLTYPDRVFRKDRVQGEMVIRDHARPGLPLVARITSGDSVLWQETMVTEGTGQRRIPFDFVLDQELDRIDRQSSLRVEQHILPLDLTATLVPVLDEWETDNNERSMRLGVVAQVYKVLILDGRPRWETRYLRNVFDRDSRWEISTVVAGSGTDSLTLPRGDQPNQFPLTREKLFEYDLIVCGEIDRELFADHELDWIESFVSRRGGGLVWIDGRRGKLRDFAETALKPLIPVTWSIPASVGPVSSLELTASGAREPAFRMQVGESANREFWSQLSPPKSLVATESLPDATVLLEARIADRTFPAMVMRQSGAGRSLYLAFDETWRWRYKAADIWHQRIWNQLAILVMPTPFTVSDEYVSIDTGSISYQQGDSANLRVQLTNIDGEPNSHAIVDAVVWRDDRLVETVSLSSDESLSGVYRGAIDNLEPGNYRVAIRASGYSDEALQAVGEFVVNADESIERLETRANRELLQQMALASGGTFLLEEELGTLPDRLSRFSSGRVVESETAIWQSYGWFAVIIGLLAIEWLLRKRAGLL